MMLRHIVSPEEEGLTLQQLLRGLMGLSGREAKTAKQQGAVTVDAAPFFANQPVRAGMTVEVCLGGYAPRASSPTASAPSAPNAAEAPAALVRVLFEDDALIAVHKPAMLQCHPSPSAPRGSDTLEGRVSALLGASVHPVHRLDAETTGIVLFAKLPYAQAHLQRQMQAGTFEKRYEAWAFGSPEPPAGEIDAPIARDTPESFTRVVRGDGQRAVTRYQTLAVHAFPGGVASRLSLFPMTGRTHQLRVHMAHIGCPLLGDTRYASGASKAVSQVLALSGHQLAAVSLSFLHPLTHQRMLISCPAVFSDRLAAWEEALSP
ncbi:MAG: RluA family pseudouridine synthase [Clostridia bacterium]|nr:RluA family pseudouridine synthase [Clostridia bacterium]